MADYPDTRTPPRDDGKPPVAPHETHIHTGPTPPPEKRSNSVLAFIVGGTVVGLVILYFIFDGFGGNGTTPTSSAPVENSTTINVAPEAAPADDAATAEPAPEQPATGADVEVEPAPVPTE